MNFRIARKVLKSLAHKLAADNFGDIQVKGPHYTRQHIARATVRCNRQQKNARRMVVAGLAGQYRFRTIPMPGYA